MGNLEDNLAFLTANPYYKPQNQYPDWWVFTLGKNGAKTNFIGRVTAKNNKYALESAKRKYDEIRGI